MSKFGLFSAQSILRKKSGVVITSADGKGKVVVQHRSFKDDFEDDAFCTVSARGFQQVWERAVRKFGFKRGSPGPASTFQVKPDINKMIDSFNVDFFIKTVQPSIIDAELKKLSEEIIDAVNGDEDRYQLAEMIFEFFYALRGNEALVKMTYDQDITSAILVSKAISCLKDHTVFEIDIEAFLPALEVVFPDGAVFEIQGTKYFTACKIDPYRAISSKRMNINFDNVPIEEVNYDLELQPEEIVPVNVSGELGAAMEKVRVLIKKPEQRCDKDERDYRMHGGFPDFLDKDSSTSVPTARLSGLGKMLGTGRLDACISRAAENIQSITGAPLDHCIHFVAGRLSRMNSNKKILFENGHLVLKDK